MSTTEAGLDAPAFDDKDYETAVAQLRAEQNFALAVPAGIVAAVVGAVLWAAVVYIAEYQIGLIAIAVGALVGYAVRIVGKGVDPQFGFLGAACAALGWALGTILVDVAMLAKMTGVPIGQAFATLGVGNSISLLFSAADAMDLLFLGIAIYEGYRFAFRARI